MTNPASKPISLQRHMVKGSAWTVAVRWAVRTLGLVSTIILARLLMPADFGIVTMAMIVVGTVEIFAQTGQYQAIIRHQNPTREHYDSAWTIFIALTSILAALIFLSAPIANYYFHEPRAVLVVRILALKTFITGFENVGVVNFRRDLQFNRQFLFQVLPSFFSFFVTLGAAFILKNYWALVIGILSQEFTSCLLSYTLSSFRPRLSFAKVGDIWAFSTWTFIRNIAGYLGNQVDKMVIGGFAGAAGMGRYEIAVDVSSSPSQEINNPMISVLFPVMAKTQNDRKKLKELYLTVLYWSVLICTSTAVGVALVTSDLVDVVLGSKWTDVKPLMPWLALSYGVSGFAASIYPAFDTVGKPHISARLTWFILAVTSICYALLGYFYRSLHVIVVARFWLMIFIVPILFWILAMEFNLRRRDFLVVFLRPFLASAVMSGLVIGIQWFMVGGVVRLLVSIFAGAIGYLLSIMGVWWLIGCPDGPEKTIWHILRGALSRHLSPTVLPEDLESGEGLLHQPEAGPSLTDPNRQTR